MADTLISPPEPNTDENPIAEAASPDPQSLISKLAITSQKILFDLILPAILLAVGIASFLLLGNAKPEKRPEAGTDYSSRLKALSEVRVERLHTLTSLGQQLELIVDGSVAPFREVKVATEVSGEIIEKESICEAGAYVEAGTLLMKIDTTDYAFEVQRLQQVRQQEYQALREIEQEKDNTKRSIDLAKKDVELQQREVDRQTQLGDGFTSPAERDKAIRSLLATNQQLVTLENQLSLLEERRQKIVISEQLAITQLEKAQKDLERTEIRAPISGVIVNENAELHSFVPRGTTLVTIDDTTKAEVATSLRMDQLYWVLNQGKPDEADASQIATGEKPDSEKMQADSRGYILPETKAIIEYELAGREGIKYYWNAKLLSYDGIGLNSATRTVPVRVVVDAPNEHVDANGKPRQVSGATALVRGMYVRVKLLINPRPEWIVIPARGLQVNNRILQFTPDESVLGAASSNHKTTSENKPAEDADPKSQLADSADNTGLEFHPQAWVPGKVTLASGINPIAPLNGSTNVSQTGKSEGVSTFDKRSQRLWVCEIAGESANLIQSNPFVVVSPFEGIKKDSFAPARASATVVEADAPAIDDASLVSQIQSTGRGE